MKAEPGTYVLILRSLIKATTQVGCWGSIDLVPRYYLYVGSAFGPGGVQVSVPRHCRRTKPNHWHIDYLRKFINPIGVWYSHELKRLEHQWAQVLNDMMGISSVRGFGCTDCHCYSHLFQTSVPPDITQISKRIGGAVDSWSYQLAG